jgi:hypothetical protein
MNRTPRRAAALAVTQLEDRTTPADFPLGFILPSPVPPIGTLGGMAAAENDSADTDGNNPVGIDVLANDQPSPGATLVPSSVQVVSGPARGTVSVNKVTGAITYTAVGFFTGTDFFQYSVKDSSGKAATGQVAVVVNRPAANDDFASTSTNTPVTVDVLKNDTDPDGPAELDPASVRIVQQPQRGSVNVNPATGETTYTPANGFVGTDSWRYTVADKAGAVSAPGVVTVTVSPGTTPTASTAVDDVADTDGNNPVTVDVLANDVAAPGRSFIPGSVIVVGLPSHGIAMLDPATGKLTYLANAFFQGTDTFQYVVSDGVGLTAPATVAIVVNRPIANDDFADTDGNNPVMIDVLANDTDPDGNGELVPSSVLVVDGPARGTVSVDPATGAITYTATGFFSGTDVFRYTITDKAGAESAAGTVTVLVHRPTANSDSALAIGTSPVSINLLANDTDPDGDAMIDPASVRIVAGPSHGSVSVNPATGVVTYTPSGSFIGVDSFRYTIRDFPGAESSPGLVRVKVEAPAAATFTAAGAGAGGGPAVSLLNADGTVLTRFFAFEESFTGGVRVAVADVTGDGVADVIVAPGAGGGPVVRIFDGTDLHLVASFLAFSADFRGGVNIAAGDVDGDGVPDIIVGAGAGGGPHVAVFTAAGQLLTSFFAFDPGFRGGVSVAAADLDGDGHAEIVTGAGVSGAPQVNVFSGADGSRLAAFFAFDPAFRGGVTVALGDLNGDTIPDVILAAGPGGGPHILVIDPATGSTLQSFFAPGFTGGVQVGAADLNEDGAADLILAPAGGKTQPVIALDGQTLAPLHTSDPFDGFLGGIFVGGRG